MNSNGREHAQQERLAAQVALAQDPLLLHLLRAAVIEAAELWTLVRDLEQHPGITRIAISPATLAVACLVAARGDARNESRRLRAVPCWPARGHGGDVSDRFATVPARGQATAPLDATRLLSLTQPATHEPEPATGMSQPHLRLVPDPDHAIKESHDEAPTDGQPFSPRSTGRVGGPADCPPARRGPCRRAGAWVLLIDVFPSRWADSCRDHAGTAVAGGAPCGVTGAATGGCGYRSRTARSRV